MQKVLCSLAVSIRELGSPGALNPKRVEQTTALFQLIVQVRSEAASGIAHCAEPLPAADGHSGLQSPSHPVEVKKVGFPPLLLVNELDATPIASGRPVDLLDPSAERGAHRLADRRLEVHPAVTSPVVHQGRDLFVASDGRVQESFGDLLSRGGVHPAWKRLRFPLEVYRHLLLAELSALQPNGVDLRVSLGLPAPNQLQTVTGSEVPPGVEPPDDDPLGDLGQRCAVVPTHPGSEIGLQPSRDPNAGKSQLRLWFGGRGAHRRKNRRWRGG